MAAENNPHEAFQIQGDRLVSTGAAAVFSPHRGPGFVFRHSGAAGTRRSDSERIVWSRRAAAVFSRRTWTRFCFPAFQVGSRDPGAPLFWFGSDLAVGRIAVMHFYLHQRRLRVEMEPFEGHAMRVTVIGWNSRIPADFDRDFRSWAGQIKTVLE